VRSYDSLIGFNLRHKGDELSGSEPCCPRKIILFFFFSLAWSGAELLTPKYTEREQKLSFPGSRDELVCETGKKNCAGGRVYPNTYKSGRFSHESYAYGYIHRHIHLIMLASC